MGAPSVCQDTRKFIVSQGWQVKPKLGGGGEEEEGVFSSKGEGRLPEGLYAVIGKSSIHCHQRHFFRHRLSNQEPVEGVAVMKR